MLGKTGATIYVSKLDIRYDHTLRLKGKWMSGFIEGEDRHQATLFPERLDDYIGEDCAVRVIDMFIDDLDISGLGFKTEASDTGRPAYHPATMLKLYVYGYLNRVQSSRRLEREAQRNVGHCQTNLIGAVEPTIEVSQAAS